MTPARRDLLAAIVGADPVAGTSALRMLRNLAARELAWSDAARELDAHLRPKSDPFPWIDAETVNWPEHE